MAWKSKTSIQNKWNKQNTACGRFNPTMFVITLNINVVNSTIKKQEQMNDKDLTLCYLVETQVFLKKRLRQITSKMKEDIPCVLAPCGCYGKLLQTWWLKIIAINFLTVLETKSLKSVSYH